MKGKKWLIILLTVLVFLSGAVLGVSSVYRIDDVLVESKTLSKEAEVEAIALQKRLAEAYHKKFTPFAKEDAAYDVVEEFPYFIITSVEKAYPDRLIVHVQEDEEVYAVACADGVNYYIINREGTVLGIRDNYSNRSDETGEAKNVLLTGLTVTGEKGEKVTGDDSLSYMFAFCSKADEALQGIRRNIKSVEKIQRGVSANTVTLKLTTLEGVAIYVDTPSQRAEEKAVAAINAYLSLSDGERTRGMIAVAEVDGAIKAVHSDKDVFDKAE